VANEEPVGLPVKAKKPRTLPLATLKKICDAALENGRDLSAASQILRESGLFPQAYALGHLALEELAKATLALQYWLCVSLGLKLDWALFWAAWRDHKIKNQAVIIDEYVTSAIRGILGNLDGPAIRDWRMPSAEEAEQLPSLVSEVLPTLEGGVEGLLPHYKFFQKKRLAATYVDLDGHRVTRPRNQITDRDVADVLGAVTSLRGLLDELWAHQEVVLTVGGLMGADLQKLVSDDADAADSPGEAVTTNPEHVEASDGRSRNEL
jgi:AbiV family abortive infection protein